MKRVCFLLNNDYTTDNRVRREAESLAKAGYEVVLCCTQSEKPGVPIDDRQNGVLVRRLFRKKLYKYHAFSVKALKAFLQVVTQVPRGSIVHAHDANMLFPGWLLAKVWGAKLIYDSHEYWPSFFEGERRRLESSQRETAPAQFKKKMAQLRQTEDFERWALSRCTAVISVSASIGKLLQEKTQGQLKQNILLRNMAEAADPAKGKRFHEAFQFPPETKIVLYQGQIAEKRGLATVIDAMALIREGIVLVLMGSIFPADQLFYEAMQEKIQTSPQLQGRVFWKEAVPPAELMPWTASADLGISPILNRSTSYYYCLPNKVFEYLQAGLPLAVSDFPEMHQLVNEYQVGFTFNPDDPVEIAAKIEAHFAQEAAEVALLQKNIAKAKAVLTWENEAVKLLDLYERLSEV